MNQNNIYYYLDSDFGFNMVRKCTMFVNGDDFPKITIFFGIFLYSNILVNNFAPYMHCFLLSYLLLLFK